MLLKLEKMGVQSERGIIRITGDPISILILMIMRYIGIIQMSTPIRKAISTIRMAYRNLNILEDLQWSIQTY